MKAYKKLLDILKDKINKMCMNNKLMGLYMGYRGQQVKLAFNL
jgi:hypothetical protein